MMSSTDLVLSVAATSLILGTADPIVLSLSAVSSQLPDIDTSKSVSGRIFFPISRYLEKRFPRRSITHSFMALAIFAASVFPVALVGRHYWLGLVSGYFWGFFGDVFTKSGVAAFYPSQARAVCPGNPRFRLSTGSGAEFFVLAILIAVAIASIHVNSNGGILRTFNQILGIPSGAVEIVDAENSQYLLSATVVGRSVATQQPVHADFEVIRTMTQSDLLAKDRLGKLYRIGTTQQCQIFANRIKIQRVARIKSTAHEIQLQEQEVYEAIAEIPTERTYVSGTLTLQDAEGLLIPTHADQFDTITLQPGREITIIRLESASPDEVMSLIGEYYGSGSLIIRTVVLQSDRLG